MRLIPFVWGFSEAVFFFIVPDVWLTWLVFTVQDRKKLKTALLCATAGALTGGLLMYWLGSAVAYERTSIWLDYVPGINHALIEKVHTQVQQVGAGSVFLGVLREIPYKIYAVQWGTLGDSVWAWMLISIAVRSGRFLLSMTVASLIQRLGQRFKGWDSRKYIGFWVFWCLFYVLYFYRHPS